MVETNSGPRGVYFAFQLFGLVFLPILAFTFIFSSTVRRHPTVANNALVWTLSSFAGSMLLLTGQLNNPKPPPMLCQAQSALMLGQSPAVSTAAFALVWKVWSLTWRIETNSAVVDEPWWLTCMLLGSPYLVWIVLAVAFALVQADSSVHPITFYCTSDDTTLGVGSSIVAAIALSLCLIFQSWTVVLVYLRFRKSTRNRLGRHELGRHVTVPFFLRTMAFMVMAFIALILCFVASTSGFALDVPDIIIASCGVVTFFIFASQQDVLACWHLVNPASGTTETRMTGSELHSSSQPKELGAANPSGSIGMSLDQADTSSVWEYHQGSKAIPHLAIRVDQIELTTRCDGTLRDVKSAPSFDQDSSTHV